MITDPTIYIPNAIGNPTWCFNELLNLDWERREDAPRYEYWTSKLGKSYTYGRGRGERTYESKLNIDLIDAINNLVSFETAQIKHYEGCFMNRYENGRDHLGWHADDDPGIDHSRPIAVVTLYENPGDVRAIQYKAIEGGELRSQPLENGSLFIMKPGMQQTHLHRIPKCGYEIGRRMSLTYRGLL